MLELIEPLPSCVNDNYRTSAIPQYAAIIRAASPERAEFPRFSAQLMEKNLLIAILTRTTRLREFRAVFE